MLLAECRSPSFSGYTLGDATQSMQLMDRVLFNRLSDPAKFGASGAKTAGDIIRAPGILLDLKTTPIMISRSIMGTELYYV